jgi:hypothetical protein
MPVGIRAPTRYVVPAANVMGVAIGVSTQAPELDVL